MRAMAMGYWALPLLLMLPSSEAAAARPAYSWGKPGISRAAYDADALTCGLRAASRDVAADEETQGYVRGFEALERENDMPPVARPPDEDGLIAQANRNVLLRRVHRPDRKVDTLQAKLQGEVEACLTARGYTRFRLSRDQIGRLRKLRAGSPERRDFLYALGSDTDIVSSRRAEWRGR